jgi:hypothetical protein
VAYREKAVKAFVAVEALEVNKDEGRTFEQTKSELRILNHFCFLISIVLHSYFKKYPQN